MEISNKRTLAVEAVAIGHPDKVCDVIAGALVDAFVAGDKKSRCGIEVMMKDNIVVLGGEVYSSTIVDYDHIVRNVFNKIVYPANHGLYTDNIKIINLIGKQSMEIHNAVDISEDEIGGSDQGWMTGFATNETETFMPIGCYITKHICDFIVSEDCLIPIGPDAKTQVVIEYSDNKPVRLVSILVSAMHQCDIGEVRKYITDAIITNKIGLGDDIYTRFIKDRDLDIDINPAGTWNMGGSVSDCGMCNRKLACDQFSSASRISGGGLHGKDISKMDYSANMICRYIAKNIVAAGIANRAVVDVSYSIGVVEPTSVNIELDINKELEPELVKWVKENVGLQPIMIMRRFGVDVPRYEAAATNGHYGRTVKEMELPENQLNYPWEKFDLVEPLKKAFEPYIYGKKRV